MFFIRWGNRIYDLIDRILQPLALLAARFCMFMIFYKAGSAKVSNWPGTLFLFENEYNVPYIPHELAAYMATSMECIGSVLLLIGFLSRPMAFGFLIMTAVIEFLVYPGLSVHKIWAILLGMILIFGPGKLSVDHWIKRYAMKK